MTDAVATQTFLPWIRFGLAGSIASPDDDPAPPARAEVSIALSFGTDVAHVTLPLLGAQDVVGFDPRAVVRTWPRGEVFDAEPNYLPLVEFDQADLPWRYTPAAAPSAGLNAGQLRPWLVLIVLADGEFTRAPVTSGPDARPPVIHVRVAKLPDLAQSRAWAHVHLHDWAPPAGLSEEAATAAAEVEAAQRLATEPHQLVGRLLCPRRLVPRASYTGFLVPAFDRGRRTALGETADPMPGPLAPAWTGAETDEIRLPVFYQWRFGTGAAGDFESLARALVPQSTLPPGVGTRGMDVSAPGVGLPPAFAGPLGLEGALQPPGFVGTSWPGTAPDTFVAALESLLAAPARLLHTADATEVRAVAAPIYGRWHAALSGSGLTAPLTLGSGTSPNAPPPWLVELDRDPRWRVAAGLGTLVVQSQQHELMAGAWEQMGELRTTNEALRQAQLAREGALRLYARHFLAAADGPLLQLTAPVHAHVRARVGGGVGSPTARAATAGSVIEGALQPTWRRLSRPRGAVGRRQGRATASAALQAQLDALLTRLNSGAIAAARTPAAATGYATLLAVAGATMTPGGASDHATFKSVAPASPLPGMMLLASTLGASYASPPYWQRGGNWQTLLTSARSGTAPTNKALVGGAIDQMPGHPDFDAIEYDPTIAVSPLPTQPAPTGVDSASAAEFRAALRDLMTQRNAVAPAAAPPKTVDLAGLRDAVIAGLDPRVTVAARFRNRLHLAADLAWSPADPLEPILAAPHFDQPMYAALARLSQDWLLPGLDKVPSNSVAVLESNQRFIEAYMLGLSHEFARELVWNEYPTDQRGTYFRQFWDPVSFVPPEGVVPDPDALRDIARIHEWRGALGSHSPRPSTDGAAGGHAGGAPVVILIRGDLLRRYPATTVYATLAAASGPVPGDPERYPVFRGTLEPDVTFVGFDLSLATLRATPPDGSRWYFVLQEQPGESVFGFDEGAGDGLTWSGLQLTPAGFVDLAVTPPSVLSRGAAHVAKAALQTPVRVLIPAASLLPVP